MAGGLRRGTVGACLLGVRVRFPVVGWCLSLCKCCELSCRGPCILLITHPNEYCQVWCVWVRSWNLDNEKVLDPLGALARWEILMKIDNSIFVCHYTVIINILQIMHAHFMHPKLRKTSAILYFHAVFFNVSFTSCELSDCLTIISKVELEE